MPVAMRREYEFVVKHSYGDSAIENAKRFLDSAKKCETSAPNVSYVLATTALEEVGKAILKKQKLLEDITERETPAWISKHGDNHQKKLFWAIWTPMLGSQVITGAKMEEAKSLSNSIHSKRIKAQYSDDGNLPENAVSAEEVRNLIELTEARIGLEESYTPAEPDAERVEKMNWFLNSQGNKENSGLLFSNKSMKKLSELGDAYKWVCWLKEQFDVADVEAKKLTEAELNREIDANAPRKIKWKMTVRFRSKSHSIREGELSTWNDGIELIKIRAGNTQNKEIIVDFLLSDQYHIKTLWWQSQAFINHFLVALNIGTFGFFWWYLPTLTEKFYEKIEDLENNSEVRIESHPERPINWGNLVLKKKDLNRVALCLAFVSRCKETKIFDHYLTGLGFLAKSDVIMRFENNALEAFARSLQLIVEKYNGVSLENFLNDPAESVGEICKDWNTEDRKRIRDLVSWSFSNKSLPLKVDPDDVGIMKIITDNLLHSLSRKSAEDHFGKLKES